MSDRPIELPRLESYSEIEWQEAESWPAIARYRRLLENSSGVRADASLGASLEVGLDVKFDVAARLRLDRHRMWLRCAMATYFDRASASEVCLSWSDAAEVLIARAWIESGGADLKQSLLALGKLGSRELNLSSDVDLIAVRNDDSVIDQKSFRRFQSLLGDSTEFGYALRLDFTLRPGGRASAAIPSLGEFEYHYGYHGEMWERLAFVRMRILQGPQEINEQIARFTTKMSYRKHLDYTVIEDLKSLRSKIRNETAGSVQGNPNLFHLKLGQGGIRELELFIHALQVLHGGRHPRLQTFSTSLAIQTIADLGLLPQGDCDELLQSYWRLRTWENRLHAYEDQQEYVVDLKEGHPALEKDFQIELRERCAAVAKISDSFFGGNFLPTPLPSSLDAQSERLRGLGFNDEAVNETWPQLLAATALSRHSERDERARLVFLKEFTEKLSELKLDLNLGLSLLLDFVRATRAKASFFTLLNREPKIRNQLALLFSISPYLGSLLSSRPELIDEFIYQKTAPPSADLMTLLEELTERRLLGELVAASQFLEGRDLRKMTLNLSSNADQIAQLLLDRLKEEQGLEDLSLLALGKWGGRELGLRSDLDFVFVTRNEPRAESHKVAKRFLSRMTEAHRGGSIYSVDMRLRPSGSSGPIMVTEENLHQYLLTQSAAWERQSYLRARPLTTMKVSPPATACSRGLSPGDYQELERIRSQLFVDPNYATSNADLDLKLSFGGLADVEFAAQIALLARREFSLDPSTCGMIQYLESVDELWRERGPRLREKYDELRSLEQLFQLTTSQVGSKVRLGSDEFHRLALLLDRSPRALEMQVRSTLAEIATSLVELRRSTSAAKMD